MSRRIFICFVLILSTAVVVSLSDYAVAKKSRTNENFIRLHVVANSDSEEDQALKREVRDAMVQRTTQLFAQTKDVVSAKKIARSALPDLEQAALAIVKKRGKPYQVQAKLGNVLFPDKTYGELHLAAGQYYALEIVIGSGAGKNWWCVLFPPLCLMDARNGLAVDRLSDNQETKLSSVKLKLKLLEFLEEKKKS